MASIMDALAALQSHGMMNALVCHGVNYTCWNCGHSPLRALTLYDGDLFRCSRCDEMMLFKLGAPGYCVEPPMEDNPPTYVDDISCWKAACKEVG